MKCSRVAVFAFTLLCAGNLRAGVVEVQVTLPVPEKLDTTGMNRLLVGGFRTSDHPTLSLERELNRWLRSLYHKNTRFEVIEAEPLPLPEQSIDDAIHNTAYWKRIGTRFNAHLITGGTLDFTVSDQSGFVQEDVISELTGQRMRRSRWAEREGFKMDLGLYYFKGTTGELLYEDHFTEEILFDGKGNDALSVLQQLFDRVADGIVGITTQRTRIETRYLLTE